MALSKVPSRRQNKHVVRRTKEVVKAAVFFHEDDNMLDLAQESAAVGSGSGMLSMHGQYDARS